MKIIKTLILVLVLASIGYGQFSSRTIKYRNNGFRVLDTNYTSSLSPDQPYFSIATNTRFSQPTANNLIGQEINLPLTLSGTGKYTVGLRTNLDLQGTVTNPTIMGSWNTIFSNSTFPAGTGSVYGNYTSVDIGGPFNEAYGGYFAAISGGSGASGLVNITGLLAAVNSAHNGNTTNSFAGDFWTSTSFSTPSSVVLGAGIRSRARFNSGVDFATYRGIQITDWLSQGGVISNSVGLYIDNSIDIGTVTKYSILSESASPMKVNHDIYITSSTKGIVLRSPDNTCYRFTVANGGALSALGTAITCP